MGKCIEDKTTGKFKCTRCVNNLIVQDGKCGKVVPADYVIA